MQAEGLWKKSSPFLSPAILIIVACIQLGLGVTSKLSPWKGGGFGMFSTIESPDSRIIRVNLIKDNKKIPVQIPRQYLKLIAQIKTRPSQDRINNLAKTLSQGRWGIKETLSLQERYYQLHKKQFPSSIIPIDTTINNNSNFLENLNELYNGSQPVYMLSENEKTNHVLTFEKVEVECLQMKFDKGKNKLILQQIVRAFKDHDVNFNR